MKRALMLNAVNPRIGGVLIRGEKGTAKSTAVRALASLLPEIEVVVGCPYGCDPASPDDWCDDCLDRAERRCPIARAAASRSSNLPVGATEDRLAGTLNIERRINEGERRFEPGPAGDRQPRHPLRRRGQPAERPPGRRAARRGRDGHQLRRARRRSPSRIRPSSSWSAR